MQKAISVVRFRHTLPLLIVVLFSLLAGRHLLTPGYFNMHDDLQMMRQLEMEKCLLDGQIPCRWIPDMGYGFGFPLFNYYPPLPYIIGEVFRVVGISFVDTVKLLFLTSIVASGVFMYALGSTFFGRLGGMLAAVFYIWAPYHSEDIFVRGAMNESWALIWFPSILWTTTNLILAKDSYKKWLIPLALSWFGLLTSHNLMVLIFAPFYLVWCLAWVVVGKKVSRTIPLMFSGLTSFGLAAFFTLPAVFEQSYVQVNTLVTGYYEYNAHFVSLRQLLISRFWGYGPSVWLEDDRMAFSIGHLHWIMAIGVGIAAIIFVARTRKLKGWMLGTLMAIGVGWLAAFMTHSRSIFIWQAIGPLSFVQFPWRFLTLVIFSFSFAAGAVFAFITPRLRRLAFVVLAIAVVLLNWEFFRPEYGKMGPLTDAQKFSGAAWELQQTAGIYDYLPSDAKEAPKEPRRALVEVVTGEVYLDNLVERSNVYTVDVDVRQPSTVKLGLFKFPNWRVFAGETEVSVYVPESEKWGRMYVDLPGGKYSLTIKLYDTPLRTIGNVISLVSWLILGGVVGRWYLAKRSQIQPHQKTVRFARKKASRATIKK